MAGFKGRTVSLRITVAALALVGGGLMGSTVASAGTPMSAGPTSCGGWGVQPRSVGSHDNKLHGVAVLSECAAWAVGEYYDGSVTRTLVERWNGRAWKIQDSADPGSQQSILYDVDATSSSTAWAVGDSFDGTTSQPLIEHWNGKAWKVRPTPTIAHGGSLVSVSVLSSRNAWAVGSRYNGASVLRTLVMHWNGQSWKEMKAPNSGTEENALTGVVATTPSNAWAVGHSRHGPISNYVDRTLILHWNGHGWKIQRSPSPENWLNELNSVAATSSDSAWAVGYRTSKGELEKTLILHWDGGRWKIQPSPSPGTDSNRLNGVEATSRTNAWAVGESNSNFVGRTVIERWNGHAWTLQASPNPGLGDNHLDAVAASSAANAWAVGFYYDNGYKPLAARCC